MTLAQFTKKHTGVGVDFDGSYGYQCVDLYREYVAEVLGFPQSPGVAGAADLWDSYLPAYYERIANRPDNHPEPGDIVIWGRSFGPHGHVGICLKADRNRFTSFDQNYPEKSLPMAREHNYKGVLGWLRPRKALPDANQPAVWTLPDSAKIDLGPLGIREIQTIKSQLSDSERDALANSNRITNLEQSIAQARSERDTARAKLVVADVTIADLEADIARLSDELSRRQEAKTPSDPVNGDNAAPSSPHEPTDQFTNSLAAIFYRLALWVETGR